MNIKESKPIHVNNFRGLIKPHTINSNAVYNGLKILIIIYNIILGKAMKIDHV